MSETPRASERGGRRVVVTGATGNVGTSLVRRLLGDPAVGSVVGVARRPPADLGVLGAGVEWRAADVAVDDLREVFVGADAVVHLAWRIQPSRDPDGMWRVNVSGTERVLDAVVACGVPAFVQASSLAAYVPAPQGRLVGEEWPIGGVASSPYSWQKAYVERTIDTFEARHPAIRVVRMRPTLLVKPEAVRAVRRYFAGLLLARPIAGRHLTALLTHAPLAFQILHTDDAADAFARAALDDGAHGAFNVSTDEVLGRSRPSLEAPLAFAAEALSRLHVQPLDRGWVELFFRGPLLDSGRAKAELGWKPEHDPRQALSDTLAAARRRRGWPTPALS
ncbi:MAG: NAD-dependent epimerase/dehydratase family protein [Actinobacteria bacterium]|nr:NAD-dependent epimerase/dehydratase family protein [Actinomycetota bacterium]